MRVTFLDGGREAQCPPDPLYPNGIKVDISRGAAQACVVNLPYPAPRCGQWVIGCERCHQVNIVSAAGRPDDPRQVRIACRPDA